MIESLQAISQVASAALISSIWQGTILAAIVWLCLKLAPRTSASVRFMIWSAVFAAAAALPLLSLLTAHSSSAAQPPQSSAAAILLDGRWALGIAAVWALLTAGRLVLLAENAHKLRALWQSSTPFELTPALHSILTQPGLRGARLCTSPAVDQPCVIGFFSPRILIPAWLLEAATSSELEQIVLHESAHLLRFDDWTNLVQKLAVACFPLNPVLLSIERRLSAEREIACDERVVRATNAPRDYASCLTHLAEQRLARRTLALSSDLSLGAWERRSQLAGRVESILLGKAMLRPLQARALALSLVLATAVGAVKLGSTSQLVAFASAPSTAPIAAIDRPTTTGPHYQDVVFHPTSSSAPLAGQKTTATPAKRLITRPAVKSSARRAQLPADGMQSLVIVTRWQSDSGQQMTVVHQFVRIAALSAAPSQGGWFVVQL